MPFKSKAQQRFMFAAESRGEMPKGTAKRWAKHTPNMKDLPDKKEAALRRVTSAFLKRANPLPAPAGAAPQPGHPGAMQPLAANQPSAPIPGQKSDQVAKHISSFGLSHRGNAAYERLRQTSKGVIRGYAIGSHPEAHKNLAHVLHSKGAELKSEAYKQGFLSGLADGGITPSEFVAGLQKMAADAPELLDKLLGGAATASQSAFSGGAGLAMGGAKSLGQLAIGAPLALGGAMGVAAEKLDSPDPSAVDTLRKAELIGLYRRLARQAHGGRQ